MEARSPTISVLLGVFDNEGTVARAISSIRGQTLADLELIVIDDGSRDGSLAVARGAVEGDARCSVLELSRNVGIARSLNEGLERARAEIVAIQDADDYSDPQRLARQFEALSRDPALLAVGARMREVDSTGREVRSRTRLATGDVTATLPRFNPIPNGIVAFRRGPVVALGGYDERYRYAPDYDLWLRLADRGRLAVLDEVLATRVMSGRNVAARAERAQAREALEILFARMRRRPSLAGASGLVRAGASCVVPLGAKRAMRARRGQAP